MPAIHGETELPSVEVENLRRVCAELGIPGNGLNFLLFIVNGIRMQESGQRWKSAPKRKKELGQVAVLAKKLNDALQNLDYEEKGAIHNGFDGVQVRMFLDPPDPKRELFTKSLILGDSPSRGGLSMNQLMRENVLLLGDVLLTLEAVAKQAIDTVHGPMKGGARPDLERRSVYIVNLAELAKAHGLPVGRGREFVRLCEAAFLAAGIEVGPEPAIRKYMSDVYPAYREMWVERPDQKNDQSDEARLRNFDVDDDQGGLLVAKTKPKKHGFLP